MTDFEELKADEKIMYETIEWLLGLPAEEREKMEQATTYKYTMKDTAPKREPEETFNQMCLTVNVGTLHAAEILCKEGYKPVALNFAHGYNCGGGFEHASGSQEETLFRNSSLFLSLWPHRRADDGPDVLARGKWIGDFDERLPRKDDYYPLTECGAIYSPYVRMSRKILSQQKVLPRYKATEVDKIPTYGVISAAAQDVPRTGKFDPEVLKEHCRAILHIAVEHKHDAIILGAFGCGFFENPAEEVADAFGDLLFGEFSSAFRMVCFAIPDKDGSTIDEFTRNYPLTKLTDIKEKIEAYRRKSSFDGTALKAMLSEPDVEEPKVAEKKSAPKSKQQAKQQAKPKADAKKPQAFEQEGKPVGGDRTAGTCSNCSIM